MINEINVLMNCFEDAIQRDQEELDRWMAEQEEKVLNAPCEEDSNEEEE